jgi:hypothetical protein
MIILDLRYLRRPQTQRTRFGGPFQNVSFDCISIILHDPKRLKSTRFRPNYHLHILVVYSSWTLVFAVASVQMHQCIAPSINYYNLQDAKPRTHPYKA